MKLLYFSLFLFFNLVLSSTIRAQYTEELDTFYVPTPEYAVSLGIDSLFFPSAVTTPNEGEKFPVVILVHGTSALDKDANSTKDYQATPTSPTVKAQTRMFYEIADYLSSNGLMVLRYDKRSFTVNCIEKPPCWWADTISPYDYIKDIHHAVEFAKSLPKVDSCNVFVLGHSQGANFVADVGLARSDVRGVISLAPTALPIDSVAVYQTEFIDSDPVGADLLSDQFDSLRNGLWPMTDTLYNQVFSPRFWLDWISITDSAVITQQLSDKPTLIAYGTIDQNVPDPTHMPIWQDSISRPNVSFITFDELDHSFGTIDDSIMSTDVLNAISEWVLDNSFDCGVFANTLINDWTSIQLYPNPVVNQLHFSLPEGFEYAEIYSLEGALIRPAINQSTIDLSSLPAGGYVLRITTSSKSQAVPFWKQ